MKLYEISYPTESGDTVEVLTREEIIAYYYPHWKEKMESIGKHEEISEENCIEDWCVVHWATEINVPI
jgi:hypothetical protein